MSNRERWVIYPLLLFTFLMASRDKYVKPEHFDCKTVSCRQLLVQSASGRALVTIGSSTDDSGAIVVYGTHEPILLPGDDVGTPRRRRPGHEIVEIGASDEGGYVRVFGNHAGADLQLGHDGRLRFSGLTAINEEEGYVASPREPSKSSVWGSVLEWPASESASEEEPDATAEREDRAIEEAADESEES
jgi:hypothetical protein